MAKNPYSRPKEIIEGLQCEDLRSAIQPEPRIVRYLPNGDKQLVVGSCPICKKQLFDWKLLKDHVKECRLMLQHPLLMRACYCPYCLKKVSDGYSLSAHIHSIHSEILHALADNVKAKFGANIPIIVDNRFNKNKSHKGVPVGMMPEPFPFACSKCFICWPSAQGIVDHFTKSGQLKTSEQVVNVCGGTLVVHIKRGLQVTVEMAERNSGIACYRYDLLKPVNCPFCSMEFTEAYEMSSHIQEHHRREQLEREKRLAHVVKKLPVKRFHYAPFCCSRCKCTFKTMEEWAKHYHERIMSGQPCYGGLSIMVKATDKNGKTCFRNNNPESRVKEEPTDGAQFPENANNQRDSVDKKEVKQEPIDPDDATAQQQPKQSQGAEAVSEDTAAASSSTASKEVVIKEEPLDEDETTTVTATTATTKAPVKEEPLDEPSTSNQTPYDPKRVKSEDVVTIDSEEEYTFDCEECGIVFHNTKIYVEHMKGHGYELADEKEIAQYDKDEDPAGPAKKPKVSQEDASRYPPLLTPETPSDKWFKCPQCATFCTSLAEFKNHTFTSHGESDLNSSAFRCRSCKRLKFETIGERDVHEKECRIVQISEQRWNQLNCGVNCPFCGKRQPNDYVLLHHFMRDHLDTMKKLRKNSRMASEFLPFRCAKCFVGFEDPRVLFNHFRLREEYGIPCYGHVEVHHYELSLQAAQRLEERSNAQMIPRIVIEGDPDHDDVNSNEWCPNDPEPLTNCETNELVKCTHCTEKWPRAQLKLHYKMEHPKWYYEEAIYKCKKCQHCGYHNTARYADHYESCQGPNTPVNMREVSCAPRYDVPYFPPSHRMKMRPIPMEMGNEMRACRFCKQSFTPDGLLLHQKHDHPIEHFTDAPYQCQKCDEAGFYAYDEYAKHLPNCSGSRPTDLEDNLLAITVVEIEKRTKTAKLDIPSHRALIDVDRRRYGTLASFYRPIKCAFCESWCTSLPTLDEHHRDAHTSRDPLTFMCGGCGIYDEDPRVLRMHLLRATRSGNSRCFDMAILNGSDLSMGPPPSQTVDVNKFMMISPLNRSSSFSSVGPLKWRNPIMNQASRPNINYKINGAPVFRPPFMKPRVPLGRPVQPQGRPAQLLPIRPLNQLCKSPLSGERNLYRQQQVLAARKRAAQFVPREAANQKPLIDSKEFIKKRVDLSAPLSMPSRLSGGATGIPLSHRRIPIINTGNGTVRADSEPRISIPRRLSLSSGLPPQFRSRPVAKQPAYLTLLNPYTPSNSTQRDHRREEEILDSPPRLTPMVQQQSRTPAILKRVPGAQEPKQEPF